MDNQSRSDLNGDQATAASGDAAKDRRKRTKADQRGINARKSKKEQLIGLSSKPNGARVSVLIERLQWQGHTVRAALSGLRKQGFEVATSKAAKTGETVYAITSQPGPDSEVARGASA
ncbi:MAG: DUF3489 domain-containing protein [Aquimonas sp.]|nr:DUF3489 domain-containing protein [Aquimonas sp.]